MASLYRKYRPRTFSELVGQDSVITAIANALIGGTTVHAYLFDGPRGSGKTSLARLLAKALNCPSRGKGTDDGRPFAAADPCNACEICCACDEGRLLDLIEIDAASNRGIDNMRDIRQQVAYAPSMARHKVYIIDEVHMLSKDAANAFLKTLEEPPPFVVFILATTEVHKLLPTVVSRCQRYDFRKVAFSASLGRLKEVVDKEAIPITDDALRFIVARGDGSLRDMLGLIDQVVSFGTRGQAIDKGACLAALGMIGEEMLLALVDATRAGDPGTVLDLLDRCSRQGVDAAVLAVQLLEHLRTLLHIATGHQDLLPPGSDPTWIDRLVQQAQSLGVSGILGLLERLSEASASLRGAILPYFTLELTLLKGLGGGLADLRARVERLEEAGQGGAADQAAVKPVGAPRPPAPEAAAQRPALAESKSVEEAGSLAPVPAAAPAEIAPRADAHPMAGQENPAPPEQTIAPGPAVVPPPATPARVEGEGSPPDVDALIRSWDNVMTRIRTASLRTHALLKDVVGKSLTGGGKRGYQIRLVLQKGHRFAVERLREESHIAVVRDAVEKELAVKASVQIEEERSEGSRGPEGGPAASGTPPEKGWADQQAVQSKSVQMIVNQLEAEVIRVE